MSDNVVYQTFTNDSVAATPVEAPTPLNKAHEEEIRTVAALKAKDNDLLENSRKSFLSDLKKRLFSKLPLPDMKEADELGIRKEADTVIMNYSIISPVNQAMYDNDDRKLVAASVVGGAKLFTLDLTK